MSACSARELFPHDERFLRHEQKAHARGDRRGGESDEDGEYP
ncbi:hypothetical protein [Paeniglutamicibacter kerguelensis]